MASSSRGASDGAGGTGSECEGEEQDEPSSSPAGLNETTEAMELLTVQDEDTSKDNDELAEFRQQWRRELDVNSSPQRVAENIPKENKEDDELSSFREQWHRELGTTPSPQRDVRASSVYDEGKDADEDSSVYRHQWLRESDTTPSPQREKPKELEPQTDEEKAKQLFMRGVELERGGKLYEAIQHYKRAMQILPDVETRLYESSDLRSDTPEEESEIAESDLRENLHPSDDEDAVEGEDLLARLQRILSRKGRLCEPEIAQKGVHISWLPYEEILLILRWVVSSDLDEGVHISWLPYEVILLILRWVVSSDLDAVSLERVSAVSRGFYVAARQPDLWRSLCVRTWGIECSTPRVHGFDSWRQMYVERPRLQLNGCYISKTTYLRHGENAYQDTFYRPWYLIDYFRYLRFFPEGMVLMWTTADEPAACVPHLKYRSPAKAGLGIMTGHYRLKGKKVVIVVKKSGEKKTLTGDRGNSRFRARRKDAHETHEQTFHLELELRTVRRRRNHQLTWCGYAVSTRRDQWTSFELSPNKFPPFAFSRVRNYSAEASAPLPFTHAYS